MKIDQVTTIIKKYKFEIVIALISLAFSTWLMFSTFGYKDGNMMIASKAWSDFASHIPLIRSFSYGANFPPQYPLFSGPPIRYHFLFYAIVGILEKTGMRIDYALNIPSVLSFSLLTVMIYVFAKKVFKSKAVGILSVLFLIFNGSLDFIKFFLLHPISKNSIFEIINNKTFISFGPYDGSTISAFWNLNIYTNQRHLALSYFISLALIYFVLKPFLDDKKSNMKNGLLIGFVLGSTFLLNMAVFLMSIIIISVLLILLNGHRKNILLTLILGVVLALPQYLFIQHGTVGTGVSFYPGYLVTGTLTIQNFFNYWIQNLGFHLILIPLGLIFVPKKIRIIFICFFALFVVGNLFKFSPEIAANHKFFNYFMIVGSMFSSYFLYYIWNKKIIFRPIIPLIIFLLIFSGILDLFPILNDNKIALADYPINKDVSWIIKNIKPDSVFLNTQYLYDNASVAGRKIFLGWPYFAWSQGYDTLTRDNLRKSLLNSSNLNYFCVNAKKNNLSFAELAPTQDALVNKSFFGKNFTLVYENKITNIFIYNLEKTCHENI